VQLIVEAAVPSQLSQSLGSAGVGHLVQRRCVRQSGLGEHRAQSIGHRRSVALEQHAARYPLRRILRVQVERAPLDPRAVPALKPRRAFQPDVAERSYVVTPDDEPGAGLCAGFTRFHGQAPVPRPLPRGRLPGIRRRSHDEGRRPAARARPARLRRRGPPVGQPGSRPGDPVRRSLRQERPVRFRQ
jgi:hypothetical protein